MYVVVHFNMLNDCQALHLCSAIFGCSTLQFDTLIFALQKNSGYFYFLKVATILKNEVSQSLSTFRKLTTNVQIFLF
jgi:hypothetical protein